MNALVIEKDKLISNIEKVKKAVGVPIIGVLKGDGYGMSIVKFARVLQSSGIEMFAVCDFLEARALRDAGFEEEILLMRPVASPKDAEEIIELGLTATIGSNEAAVILNGTAQSRNEIVNAHIEVDTGFGRYGFGDDESEKIINVHRFTKNINLNGIYTHFSNSFGNEGDTRAQFDKFKLMLDLLESEGITFHMRHAANSCAALRFEYTWLDAVRIGSAFLGRLPIKNQWGLETIGYLTGDVIETRWLPAKQNVGYANVYRTKKAARIAVVPLGYSDGLGVEKSKDTFRTRDILRYMFNDFKRFFTNRRLYGYLNGKKVRILGRICMRNVIVDVTKVQCSTGDTIKFQANPLFVDKSVLRAYISDGKDDIDSDPKQEDNDGNIQED